MRREAWLRATITGLLLLACAVWRPSDPPRFRLCGFYLLTKFDCPLCGLTRGLCAAAKGEWRHAMALHPMSPVALAWLAGAFVISLAAATGHDWNLPEKLRSRLMLVSLALLVACWPFRLAV